MLARIGFHRLTREEETMLRTFAVALLAIVGYLWHVGSAEEKYPYYDAVIEGFSAS
jgi:hypothetical protein